MNKEQIYFPHYVNTRNDRRIKRLRKDLGIEGYGAFMALFEVLREQIDFRFPISDIDLLADEIGISEAKLKTIIMNYELFLVDSDLKFFSAELIDSIQPFLRMKQQRIDAINSRWEKNKNIQLPDNQDMSDTTVLRPYYDRNTPVIQSKVNESKVNESNIDCFENKTIELDKEKITLEQTEEEYQKTLDDNYSSVSKLVSDAGEAVAAEKKEIEEQFERAWIMYGLRGVKKISKQRWMRLNKKDRDNIFLVIERYVKDTPDERYRKTFEVFISSEYFKDLLIKYKIAQLPKEQVKVIQSINTYDYNKYRD